MTSRRGVSSSSLCFTLDVLTDGSEYTGHGTIFLSVWRRPKIAQQPPPSSAAVSSNENNHDGIKDDMMSSKHPSWLVEIMDTTTPLARYAISGLGDATARLCADQRVKLAPTRAVFLPSTTSSSSIIDSDGGNTDGDNGDGGGGACWEGLPALLLALHTAGAPSLHIVATSTSSSSVTTASNSVGKGRDDNTITCGEEDSTLKLLEDLASIVLGRHKDLEIRTCHVPTSTSHQTTTTTTRWWRVYEDEYIIVHATNDHISGKGNIIFLYSLHLEQQSGTAPCRHFYTIALLPPQCCNVAQTFHSLTDLPILDDPKKQNGGAVTIDCILALDPSTGNTINHMVVEQQQEEECQSKLPPILVTLPNNSVTNKGILIRSQKIANKFHSVMPWAFPSINTTSSSSDFTTTSSTDKNGNGDKNYKPKPGNDTANHNDEDFPLMGWTKLRSCSSVWFDFTPTSTKSANDLESDDSDDDDDDSENDDDSGNDGHYAERVQLVVVDRSQDIWARSKSQDWSNTLSSLQTLVTPPQKILPMENDENEIDLNEDENEIDINDEDDDEEENNDKKENGNSTKQLGVEWESSRPLLTRKLAEPHMLVLGTGCASPSALRGASGYALVFPTNSSDPNYNPSSRHGEGNLLAQEQEQEQSNHVVLLDCGEGVTTMLSRYGGTSACSSNMALIVGVWISHAHLDHYGGLPTLIRVIQNDRSRRQRQQDSTRRRAGTSIDCNGDISRQTPPSKQARLGERDDSFPPPWVMAPPKVLTFLDMLLDCQNGKRRGTNEHWFIPLTHHNHRHPHRGGDSKPLPMLPPPLLNQRGPPLTWFQNVPVLHSCGPSFGLLLGWDVPGRQRQGNATTTTGWFCFSGDTRPCRGLVQACQHAFACNRSTTPTGAPRLRNSFDHHHHHHHELFLMHEATFQDDDQQAAIQKKHSTVSEALMVASDIANIFGGCTTPPRVLLTHFSQRYTDIALPTATPTTSSTHCQDVRNSHDYRRHHPNSTVRMSPTLPPLVTPAFGLAMDGLWLKLST